MSTAYFIVAEREVSGLDIEVNGKALGHVRDEVIEKVCEAAGVRPFMEFFSSDPDEDVEFFEEEGIDPPPEIGGPEQWFDAADGLRTVRAMLERVAELVAAAEKEYRPHVEQDLRDFETVLTGLEKAGVRWHLAVDF